MSTRSLFDLYNEKASILDGDGDSEVDLASQAYQIWKSATDANPKLKTIIERLPNVAFSTRAHQQQCQRAGRRAGLYANRRRSRRAGLGQSRRRERDAVATDDSACSRLFYRRTSHPAPAGAARSGESQAWSRSWRPNPRAGGGQLGGASSPRRRTYERLKQYADATRNTLFPPSPELLNAIDEIYRYPLRETARDTLGRQLRSGITDDQLAQLVVDLRAEDRLCLVQEYGEQQEPQIICSLGLFEEDRF